MSLNSDPDCIFCKIVAGGIPCHQLYEDDLVLAFLDVGPLSEGHALVIPKSHAVELADADQQAVERCAAVAKQLGPVIVEQTGAAGWNLLQNNGSAAGQEVGHVHFHIIPRRAGDGLGYRWNAGAIDHDDAGQLATKIASSVNP